MSEELSEVSHLERFRASACTAKLVDEPGELPARSDGKNEPDLLNTSKVEEVKEDCLAPRLQLLREQDLKIEYEKSMECLLAKGSKLRDLWVQLSEGDEKRRAALCSANIYSSNILRCSLLDDMKPITQSIDSHYDHIARARPKRALVGLAHEVRYRTRRGE